MHKVGNFDIFKEYDFFEVNMFDVIITKNCIKPTEDIVKEMLKYSLINNSDLFNIRDEILSDLNKFLYLLTFK